MHVRIACVGRLKEAYWREAAHEYTKRLSRYLHLRVEEVQDEPAPEAYTPAQREKVLEKEGERLLQKIGEREYVVGLCIEGEAYTSEGFAAMLAQAQTDGRRLVFVLGGSLGLSPAVLARCDKRLSLSNMTLPHQLARVVLLEQVYRGMRIVHGHPYHK